MLKLPLANILKNAWLYCATQWKAMLLFAVLNYIVCAAAFYSWKTAAFWLVLLVFYVLWGSLFRYYFKRSPYLAWKPLFASMVPSSKILALMVLVVSVLLLLPLLPLFLPFFSVEFIDAYSRFLQLNFQESEVLDALINLVVTILSPFILYRPMFAWISSLIGRSGLLRTAFDKTKGNYWEFLLLSILINLSTSFIFYLALTLGAPLWFAVLPLSVLTIYFNVVLAEAYSFFFLRELV